MGSGASRGRSAVDKKRREQKEEEEEVEVTQQQETWKEQIINEYEKNERQRQQGPQGWFIKDNISFIPQFRCGGPSLDEGGELIPVLRYRDRTDAIWTRNEYNNNNNNNNNNKNNNSRSVSTTPILSRATRSEGKHTKEEDYDEEEVVNNIVLLYRLVIPRPPHVMWAFYNDTIDTQFYITIRFDPHPLQTHGRLLPLGSTTLIWLEDKTGNSNSNNNNTSSSSASSYYYYNDSFYSNTSNNNNINSGRGAVAKLVVRPTETALAVVGNVISYRISVEGNPTDVLIS